MIESTYFPPVFWNCLKFKLGPKFLGRGGKPILQNKWIYISVFKTWRMQVLHHLISMHSVFLAIYVVRFQYILCSSFKSNFTAFSSLIYNLLKLKRGPWFPGKNQFWRTLELFGPLFCISILKVLRTQILRHSLDFNEFCMIQEQFS